MLTLKAFLHLPQLDEAVAELVDDKPGLFIVAGLDPRPTVGVGADGGFLPSGRATFFRTLMREMMEREQPDGPNSKQTVIVAPKDSVRLPRHLQRRAVHLEVTASRPATQRIEEAVQRQPALLVVNQINTETAQAVTSATRAGISVPTQMDTVALSPSGELFDR